MKKIIKKIAFAIGVLLIIFFIAMYIFLNSSKREARRLKQSEAKVNLKNLAASEAAFYLKNNFFAENFEDLKWEPVGKKSFYYSFYLSRENFFPSNKGVIRIPMNVIPVVTKNTYNIVAVGNIDKDDTTDIWVINEKKELKNLVNDVEN